jgi:hypothetical protein
MAVLGAQVYLRVVSAGGQINLIVSVPVIEALEGCMLVVVPFARESTIEGVETTVNGGALVIAVAQMPPACKDVFSE